MSTAFHPESTPELPGAVAVAAAIEPVATAGDYTLLLLNQRTQRRAPPSPQHKHTHEPASKRHKGEDGPQSQGQATVAAHLAADSAAESVAGDCALNALSVVSSSQETEALSQLSSQGDESDMQLKPEPKPQVERVELPSSQSQPETDAVPLAAAPSRSPSKRDRKRTSKLAFDELPQKHQHVTAATVAAAAATATAISALGTPAETAAVQLAHAHSDGVNDADGHDSCSGPPSPVVRSGRVVVRDRGGGVKVPKSTDHWMVVGVFVASRDFPSLPFWLPLVEPGTTKRVDLAVPYKTMMATLSPKYSDRKKILLHVRVVQRVDRCGQQLTGEERYLCTDIGVSYHMGDNAFKWISFQ